MGKIHIMLEIYTNRKDIDSKEREKIKKKKLLLLFRLFVF